MPRRAAATSLAWEEVLPGWLPGLSPAAPERAPAVPASSLSFSLLGPLILSLFLIPVADPV